jgi:hypothetical protein
MKVSAVAMPVVVPLNVKEVAVRTLPVAVEAMMEAAAMSSGPVAALTVTATVRELRAWAWLTPEGDESPVAQARVHVLVPVAAPFTVITTFAAAVPPPEKLLSPAVVVAQPDVFAHSGDAEPVVLGITRVIWSPRPMSTGAVNT